MTIVKDQYFSDDHLSTVLLKKLANLYSIRCFSRLNKGRITATIAFTQQTRTLHIRTRLSGEDLPRHIGTAQEIQEMHGGILHSLRLFCKQDNPI